MIDDAEYTGVKDSDGNKIFIGDTIRFSYGIPPVGVVSLIHDIDGKAYAMTPGHNPDKCLLRHLKKHVGDIYSI